MKTLLLIIIVVFSIGSCNSIGKRTRPNFKAIEITYNNGWTGGQTVYIDSSGIIVKCKYHIISEIDSAVCCIDTLSVSQMDSIISKFEHLKTFKIDSIYNGHCQDCGGYIIKLISFHDTIKSMIIGSEEFKNEIAKFSQYITEIKIKPNKVDSIYIFETTKYLIPPKLPESIKKRKFLPPRNVNNN